MSEKNRKKKITYVYLECPYCGETDIDIFANYCPNCGASLKGIQPKIERKEMSGNDCLC